MRLALTLIIFLSHHHAEVDSMVRYCFSVRVSLWERNTRSPETLKKPTFINADADAGRIAFPGRSDAPPRESDNRHGIRCTFASLYSFAAGYVWDLSKIRRQQPSCRRPCGQTCPS